MFDLNLSIRSQSIDKVGFDTCNKYFPFHYEQNIT